ncbi:MAG TPA: thrombospondin type 3 repeat-containing protein [Candidatus Polarisedimenticolaceae bacterium]|nr:thrombospondin type 3 repeat-containing protein [Candidatus Polarisedimenticolaceae bacterium]
MRRPAAALAGAVVLLVATLACTEPDETVTVDIGTTRPALADSDLATQVVEVGIGVEGTIQAIVWNSVEAFEVAGLVEGPTDLTFDEPCSFIDTAVVGALFVGKCGGGLIVESDSQPRPAVALETFSVNQITVHRVRPLSLDPGLDQDVDGVPNASDNCVLVNNPQQTDTGMKGFGDACQAFDPFFGLPLVDNDADGVPDFVDNCPATKNPDQADDGTPVGVPPDEIFVRDGMGNACAADHQTAVVQVDNDGWTFPVLTDFIQPFRANSWLTVDFNDQSALDCDWNAGTCTIVQKNVRFCFNVTGGFACDPS